MKPEAQRIAIAEACGKWSKNTQFAEGDFDPSDLPDYLKDLNARRSAWNSLSENERFVLRGHLSRIALRKQSWVEEAEFWPEAFLRTKGLWEESPINAPVGKIYEWDKDGESRH